MPFCDFQEKRHSTANDCIRQPGMVERPLRLASKPGLAVRHKTTVYLSSDVTSAEYSEIFKQSG